jgi:hypothetical protein
MFRILSEAILFRNRFTCANFTTEQRTITTAVVNKKLMLTPDKKLSASRTHNWYLLPFLLTLRTAEFECAYSAANGAFIENFLDPVPGRQSFLFEYLENMLSRRVSF